MVESCLLLCKVIDADEQCCGLKRSYGGIMSTTMRIRTSFTMQHKGLGTIS